MPSDEGSRRFSDSPFMRVAAAAQAAESLPELSDELARGLRNAAGSLLLTALRENASQLTDPLAVLDGSMDPATLNGLVQEACVAMAYVLHRALARTDFTEKQAIAVVQAATCVALRNGELPVADMSRYFATDMPADEFHRASCRLLGILGTDAAEQAIASLVERLAQDALACATSLQGCLRRVG
jgi:hypothetical protein